MKRRLRLAALPAALLLAGCNSTDTIWGQYYQVLRQSAAETMGDGRISRAQAAAIPYASLGYQVGGGPEMILVLATDDGEQLWTASSHVVLMTKAGRVLRTRGLVHDLGTILPSSGPDLPPPMAALSRPVSYTRLVDITDLGVYGALQSCRMSGPHPETITILGSAIKTMRVNETCETASLAWKFTDSFWIDAQSGLVWRSIQHVHPKLDELRIEIFRPPG